MVRLPGAISASRLLVRLDATRLTARSNDHAQAVDQARLN
jgi:hypothetical protein